MKRFELDNAAPYDTVIRRLKSVYIPHTYFLVIHLIIIPSLPLNGPILQGFPTNVIGLLIDCSSMRSSLMQLRDLVALIILIEEYKT
jgi:hypothetical protein